MANTDLTRREHGATFERSTTETQDFHLQPFKGVVLEVEDEHFHHDSAVLLPNYPATVQEQIGAPSLGLSVLAECLKHQSANPQKSVLITGHADTSGPDQYNIGISIKRAKAVFHAIMGEREPWIAIAVGQHKVEDYQLILKWVADVWGWDCDPQGVDNNHGPHTTAAVKNFQKTYNLEFEATIATDGVVGHDTWGAFFDLYMDMVENLCETDADGLAVLRTKMNYLGPQVVGCGENWPIEEPNRPDYRSIINRRVEILFFNPGEEPELLCHPGGPACTPLLCQVYNLKMYKFSPLPVVPSPPKPREVFLKLTYIGPDDDKKERPFPTDFPVTVVWKDKTPHVEKVKADGLLQFGVPNSQSPFTIQFDTADTYIATAADDSSARTDHQAGLKDLHTQNFRFFKVPDAWTLQQSDWTPEAAPHYDPATFLFQLPTGRFGKTLGGSAAPEKLKLDPHWTYLRFEFFDRFFGHAAEHNHLRINIPATLIDGWRTSPPAATPDTRSHWTVRDDDVTKSVHAIPWIIQFLADRTADPKPDQAVQFGFTTDPGTFVISDTAASRKIDVVADANKLKPSAERLKLYDLPPLWKSAGYFTRFPDGTGEYFDQAATFEDKIKASTSADAKLTFSLDDIILTGNNRQPVVVQATDRVAVFYHKFVKAAEAGKTSDCGVYKFDDTHNTSYFSEIDLKSKNYINDYPNWTRLVIAQENMFEAFADRTPAGAGIVGARAAVRWVDSPATGPPAGPAGGGAAPTNMARGVRTDQPFFSLQPFFEERWNQTNMKFTGPNATQSGFGRYDMALLRCCDHELDKANVENEVFANLHYFRFLLSFNPAPPPPPTPPAVAPPVAVSPFHPPTPAATITTNRAQYGDNLSKNIANRWNGNDVQNTKRAELLPQGADKVKGQVLFFIQPVAVNTRAHYTLQIVRPGAGQLGGRAWMFAPNGTGELGENNSAMEQQHAQNSYTAAHETGHGDSFPDEYNERSLSFSNGELSYQCNTPGDPFELDDKVVTIGATAATTVRDSGMMRFNVNIRNRYFWHCAEFSRLVTKAALKVKYDAFEDYLLPPFPGNTPGAPHQSYVWWPINQSIDLSQGTRGKFDVLLYALGKDAYSQSILANGPFDGILVVMVKVEYTLWTNSLIIINQVMPQFNNSIDKALNNKFYATGTVNSGTPQAWTFQKCLIVFSPRCLVSNNNSAAPGYQTLLTFVGNHFTAQINNTNPPNTRWTANQALTLEYTTAANFPSAAAPVAWDVQIRNQFANRFCGMIGLAENVGAVNAAALTPIVQSVITLNGNVHTLP